MPLALLLCCGLGYGHLAAASNGSESKGHAAPHSAVSDEDDDDGEEPYIEELQEKEECVSRLEVRTPSLPGHQGAGRAPLD
jgi:hypothetical protein